MEVIDGVFYMKGCGARDPRRLRTAEDLLSRVREVGFLPLFSNAVEGFSVEEQTTPDAWWEGDPARDPWEWRQVLASNPDIAYGKFFDRKAGFISREWFPVFANERRNGYDFDALYEDGFASYRAKKVMDTFAVDEQMRGRELMGFEIRAEAGFGKDGEKGFEGVMTQLQMQTYLLMGDFRQKRNKKGQAYGWHIAVMETPETKWGYDFVTSMYAEDPGESRKRILQQMKDEYPAASDAEIRKVLGIKR